MSIFAHPFMHNAFLAGTAIAAACGLAGFFLVLRAQVFTGDALSHVAFTGARPRSLRASTRGSAVRGDHRRRGRRSACSGRGAAPTTS